MSWRLQSIVGEAIRNFVTAPLRSLVLVGLVASLIGALVLAELSYSDDLIDFTRQFERSGGYVAVATSEDRISASRCERLNDHTEIVAAGAVLEAGSGRLATAPGTIISTVTVTQGLFNVWDPRARYDTLRGDGTGMGQALAEELAFAKGTPIHFTGHDPTEVAAVVDTEERNPYVSRALLTIGPPIGTADECWVEFRPGAFNASLPYLQTLFVDAGPDLTVRRWITLDEFARNPVEELKARVQRSAWLLVASLTSLIAWLMIWFRRSELGLYRALGTTRSALLLLMQSEIAIVVLLALPIGVAWATVVHTIGGTAPTEGQLLLSLRSATLAAALAAAIAPLAALLIGRHTLLTLLKDR